jgi:phosphopantetheine adenylyltransferase
MQKQRKTKYQIAEIEQRLQKLNKYLLKIEQRLQKLNNLQKLNADTKLHKLKGSRNTKIISETDEIPKFAEAEDKISLQNIFGALQSCVRD